MIEGELCSDHGGPIWAQYFFYHNTVLRDNLPWRNHYGFGMGNRGLKQSQRRVFNNIFAQAKKNAGLDLPAQPQEVNLQVDGNLFWGLEGDPSARGDLFSSFRQSKAFEESKKQYENGHENAQA